MIAFMENKDIIIKRKERNKKLFGSIAAKDIAQELRKIVPGIDEKTVVLPKPIKNLGEYKIDLNFDHDLKTHFNLLVRGE